ncbi:Hypothetical protein CINCED_3A001432 [Cinara cedri]|uniref:Uncharacterized protein n=1 Tax=Cinara cedri TaxID=506608 RepID=A0A5E4LYQ7_9HEMI|nr:Hypothetical protein CINCED_3A001432 [Cinara cedri]
MRRYTEQSSCTNCRCNGKNDQKFSGILILSPEGESKQTCSDKIYKIYEENPPWVVKKIQATDSSLPEKQMDWNIPEDNNSQDSFMSVSSEEIDSCYSDVSVIDNQDIINEKIARFLEWGIKESIQKHINESYPGSFNPDQSQHRLLSGLDENDQHPEDKTNNIEKTNSCHVNWNEYVEYYRYPVESSLSTIDVNTHPLKNEEIIRTRSQPNLSDDYNFNPNDTDIQQNNSEDGLWNNHTYHTNSFKHQANSTHLNQCLCEYNKYGDHLSSHSNKKDEQFDFNHSKKYTNWHKDDSNMNRIPYHNNSEIPKPFLNNQNSFDSFIYTNADKINNNSNSCQCSTSTKSSIEKYSIKEDQKINQHKFDNLKSDRIKKINNSSINITSKKDHDCHLCGYYHNTDKNSDDSKNSIKSRNKQLRQLLGLKPDEKNVLVMLKL